MKKLTTLLLIAILITTAMLLGSVAPVYDGEDVACTAYIVEYEKCICTQDESPYAWKWCDECNPIIAFYLEIFTLEDFVAASIEPTLHNATLNLRFECRDEFNSSRYNFDDPDTIRISYYRRTKCEVVRLRFIVFGYNVRPEVVSPEVVRDFNQPNLQPLIYEGLLFYPHFRFVHTIFTHNSQYSP